MVSLVDLALFHKNDPDRTTKEVSILANHLLPHQELAKQLRDKLIKYYPGYVVARVDSYLNYSYGWQLRDTINNLLNGTGDD